MINDIISNIEQVRYGSLMAEKMYIGSTVVWQAPSQENSRLPQGYIEVQYIKSTSSGGQYIDVNIMLYDVLNKNYDIAIKFNMMGNGVDNNQPTLFGCQNTTNPWPGTFIRINNVGATTVTGRYIGSSTKDNNLGNINTDIELPARTSPNKNVYNLNNGGKTHTWGTSLFCTFNNQEKTSMNRFCEAKLYYFKLFVEGTLVRDMVPCINPNNVAGLYDIVNDVFYSSPNGAKFEAGPYV